MDRQLSLNGKSWMVVAAVVIACALAGVGLASAASGAFATAQDTAPQGNEALEAELLPELDIALDEDGENAKALAENRYQQMIHIVALDQLRLDMVNIHVAGVQKLIDEAKAKGQDTSALEAALANLKTAIGAAQSAHDQAASLLASHAGFDGSGKVTDLEQARETLHAIAETLHDGREAMREAGHDFKEAMHEFRRANKP